MAKLEFNIKANKQPVDELYNSINRIKKLMENFNPSDSGFEEWIKHLGEYPKKLKETANEIEKIKSQIASFNNWDDKKGLNKLAKQLETTKDKYDLLAQKTVDTFNELQSSTNRASAELLSSQKNVDSITWKLIDQKKVVADLQSEIRRLNEAYRSADKESKPLISAQITSKKKQLEDERVSLNNLRAEQERARLTVKGLKDEMSGYDRTISNLTNAQEKNEISLKKLLATFGGIAAVKSFISDMVRVRGEFQKTQMAFETMLGSKEKADMLMSQMVQTAAKTPFDLQGVANGAKQLLAYGTAAENVNDTLVRLGNIASGLSIPLGDLVYLYGTTQTQGRLFTQDVRQFMGRGIPLVKELASLLGKTEEEINKMVTAGQIGFTEVEKVIKKMTDEGGQFYNLMEKQSQTLSGQISNLGDAWDQMLNSIGEDTQGVSSATISMATGIVENYERIGKVLLSLIGVYGTYKTAVIALGIAENIRYQATLIQMAGMTKMQAVTEILRAKTDLLNKTMLANPYVLLATIVAGFAATMWVLHDSTTAAEKAQKRFNDRIEEQKKKTEEHKAKIEELINTINSEIETEYERNKALKALKELYPEIFEKYDIETLKLADILSLKKQIAEIEEQKTFQSDKDYYVSLVNKRDKMDKELSYRSQNYGNGQYKYGEFQSKTVNELKKEREGLAKEIDLMYSNIMKRSNSVWDKSTPKEVKIISLERNIEDLKKEKEELEKIVNPASNYVTGDKSAYDPIGQTVSPETIARLQVVNGLLADQSKELGSLKQTFGASSSSNVTKEITDATEKIAALKQELANLRSGKTTVEAGKTVQSVIEEKAKELKATEDALATLTGKNRSSDKKFEDEQKKQLEKQKAIYKELLDLRLHNQQEEINQMKDGSEKKIAQINLDYDKEIAAILAKEKEWKDAQGGKLTEEQTVEIRMAKVNSGVNLITSTSAVNTERLEEEERAMNEYLKEYGTYLEKRQAITELYNERIAKATTEGEKLTLGEEMKKALATVDEEAQKKTSIITKLFSDMSKRTVADIRTIADEAQSMLDYVNGGEFKTGSDGNGLFGLTKEQFDILSESPEKLQSIKDEIANVNREADRMDTSFNKVSGGLRKVFSAGDDSSKLKEGLEEISEGMGDIMRAGQFLADTFSQLGDAFGSEFLGKIAEGLNVAMDAVNSAMDGAKAGAMFGPIGAAAGAAIGLVSSLAVSIAKIHDAKNERRIQRMQDQIETLDKSYERLGDSIGKAYSKDASSLIDQQNKLLEQQKVLINQQIREEQEKKKTDKDRIKDWQDQLEEIDKALADNKEKAKDAIFGEDLRSAIDNFAQAYVDAWAAGEDRAKSMKDVAKNMIKQMIVELIKSSDGIGPVVERIRDKLLEFWKDGVITGNEQAIIDKMVEDAANSLDGKLGWADKYLKEDDSSKSIFSSDSISDTIIDGLKSGKSGIKDFAGSFEDMMREAILNSLKTKYLEGPLKEFQKKFSELSESGDELTASEIEELKNMYADIISGAREQFDSLKEISGLDFSPDRSASSKGIASISQDSANLIDGKMSTQLIFLDKTLVQVTGIAEQMRFIHDLQSKGWKEVEAIRRLSDKVAENTGKVAEISGRLEDLSGQIAGNTKVTASGIKTINDKGVLMRSR